MTGGRQGAACSSDAVMLDGGTEKGVDVVGDALGLLPVGAVAGALVDDEASAGDRREEGRCPHTRRQLRGGETVVVVI